jgi:HD domain
MENIGETKVTESQALLNRIAALRQQLEQVKRLSAGGEESESRRLQRLGEQLSTGAEHIALLDTALRQLTDDAAEIDAQPLPKLLTARARRLLERGRLLLEQLRPLAEVFGSDSAKDTSAATCYRETAAMAQTALRMVQAFPDAPSAQLRLCDGLEVMLQVIGERIAAINAALAQRRTEEIQIGTLADLLSDLYAGKSIDISAFVALAEPVLAAAQEGAPLRFFTHDPDEPAWFLACHSLTVAQVVARVVRHDPDFRKEPLEPVLAALLHDAGMLSVSPDILAQPGPLDETQRRAVEQHTRVGSELMASLLPSGGWLADAARSHHERLDGTGYPVGLRGAQIAPLTRLIAVCDVYAALCARRPQRGALDTRTALTDTLLMAEQNLLDAGHAERLLQLTFYPVGSVVELADGAVGVVVATHLGRGDLNLPARPVIALLTDGDGRPFPLPAHVDLAQNENRSILRSLPARDRRGLLGSRYLQVA